MSYQIIGTVKLIEEQQTFSSGFTKQEFVVTTEEKFPQDVKLEATKEKIEKLANVTTGDRVDVSFNIRGNEYQGRYFVNLQMWEIKVLGKASVTSTAGKQRGFEAGEDGSVNLNDGIEEDVPY